MENFILTTPVVFIIFNRPDTTKIVFEEIRKARPPKLFIISDGARENKPGEGEKCKEAREIVNNIDWECKVFRNYSEKNMGCKVRVSSGLDWVFSQVEEAIIIEDDCLPDPSFFRYCQELLEKYREDRRVMLISGDNFQFNKYLPEHSYYFSKYNHIWGWASWKRAWELYDVNMQTWPEFKKSNKLKAFFTDKRIYNSWVGTFDKTYSGQIDTWDYQWTYTCWSNSGLSVLPRVNLITNIGFREDATHTRGESIYADMKKGKLDFPLNHPIIVTRDLKADNKYEKSQHPSIITKVLKKIFK